MKGIKRLRLTAIVIANIVALATLVTMNSASTVVRGDFCPKEATGCDCFEPIPFVPGGCHDNFGEEFICHGAGWCE